MELQKHFLVIFSSMLVLMALSLILYIEALKYEDKIALAATKRYQSYMLADELRQSSDDLTRMARTYVVTGEPRFKEYFDRILAIRNGTAPRPLNYYKIYWDFMAASGVAPRVDTAPKSLKKLMQEAEFTETEFALLEETESESNELANLENQAMDAMKGDTTGRYGNADPAPGLARSLLYGDDYHQAKKRVMTPLEKFFDAVDFRTASEVLFYTERQQRVNLILMITLSLATGLALVSLVLGGWSLRQRKSADSGKSRLAQRLASSGYTAPDTANKGSARQALAQRLSGKAKTASGKQTVDSAPQFFLRYFWQNWPFIVAATIVTFLILGVSWWFVGENRIQSYARLNDELKFTLDSTRGAVLDWLRLKGEEADELADTTAQDLAWNSSPWRDLPASGADPEVFDSYLVVNPEGIVLSSNREALTGNHFPFPEGTLERLQRDKRVVLFPDPEADSDLLSQHIAFGALMDANKGAVFIMTSPQRELATILRRGYSGNYGEVYLVDAEGRFISEPRWKAAVMGQGRVDTDTQTTVGRYAARQGNAAPGTALPLSVRSVTTGRSGGELQEYENYLGEQVVGYWNWNNTYGFGIINEFKSADALATSRAFTRQALAGSGITAGLILALTLLSIWNRTRAARTNEQLRRAFREIKSHNDKLAQDIRIGQKVQMDMLPDPIEGEGFTLEAFLKPAQGVSGDFYDFSQTQDGKIYFCLGDVSGKGIPASLFMSVTKALLYKTLDQTDQTKDIVTRVNGELSENNESNMFVTLVVGMMNLRTGELLITNAGHNLPYLKKHSGEALCLEEVQGPLVGTFEDVEFKQQSIMLEKGDMVLFYSDGVTEAMDIREKFYEDERLQELLEKNSYKTAKEMTGSVFRSVIRFMGRAEQFDDITILSFQYTGGSAPPAS